MKIIIIEGTDNTGKNTIIQKIIDKYNIIKIIHCCKPKATDPKEAAIEQDRTFTNLILNNISDLHNNSEDVIIYNRCLQGEYVYGCLYRNNDEETVLTMIKKLETMLKFAFGDDNIYYLTFLSSDPNILVKNDDGLSLSNGKIEKIQQETKRFEDVFEKSVLKNKKLIYINEGNSFRQKEDIWNEVNEFIS